MFEDAIQALGQFIKWLIITVPILAAAVVILLILLVVKW